MTNLRLWLSLWVLRCSTSLADLALRIAGVTVDEEAIAAVAVRAGYEPTAFEENVAHLVEQYDLPLVMATDSQAYALPPQARGRC